MDKKITNNYYLKIVLEGASWTQCTMGSVAARLGFPGGSNLEVALIDSLVILGDDDKHTKYIAKGGDPDAIHNKEPDAFFGKQILDTVRDSCRRLHLVTLQKSKHSDVRIDKCLGIISTWLTQYIYPDPEKLEMISLGCRVDLEQHELVNPENGFWRTEPPSQGADSVHPEHRSTKGKLPSGGTRPSYPAHQLGWSVGVSLSIAPRRCRTRLMVLSSSRVTLSSSSIGIGPVGPCNGRVGAYSA